MKRILLSLGFLLPVMAMAGNYSVDWFKITGGGGTSGGGQYTVNGTIGQHDAGLAMNGGQYSVTGGFWSLISVVQMAGAPALLLTQAGNSIIISWPLSVTGYVLQQNADLATTNWIPSSYTVVTNGSLRSITISSHTGNLFFRLTNP